MLFMSSHLLSGYSKDFYQLVSENIHLDAQTVSSTDICPNGNVSRVYCHATAGERHFQPTTRDGGDICHISVGSC
ncbi:MAG: hypothetical protein LBS77_03300, partial [Desulfovibrio sp.]|nr:hypothetical protein [Desulfovibrio sp.]